MESLIYNLTLASWPKEVLKNAISFATEAYLDHFGEDTYVHTHDILVLLRNAFTNITGNNIGFLQLLRVDDHTQDVYQIKELMGWFSQ